MKRAFTVCAMVAFGLVSLQADVTLTQKMTIEGPAAAAMGGAQPTMTTRIKGNKSRSDVEVMNMTVTSITDLDKKQVIILNAAQKTAQVISMGDKPAAAPGSATPPATVPQMDIQYKATGSKRTIEGMGCDDHSFSMTMDMGAPGAMPPEAAEMMKGVRIIANGVTCIAKEGKGVAEFMAFQKSALSSGLMSAVMGIPPGQSTGGGMDKLMAAAASAPGIPLVTEITMTFEGTGPMVEAMKQMGGMKMVQTTTGVSTDAIADDLFQVPADYKTITPEKK